jgi:16S rRNA (uracil1498-N3)-methyltransferase
MTRKCFFVDRIDPCEDSVILGDRAAHHVESVLRMGEGDAIELCDGAGNGWKGVIAGREAGGVRICLREKQLPRNESPLNLTLGLAFARSDRMELVLRQATEIGVHGFMAFRARRSQYGLSGGQAAKKRERWEKIAREAMCQCGRMKLPEIHLISDLPEFIHKVTSKGNEAGDGLRIVAWEEERGQNLMGVWRSFPECRELTVVVGPEGGWTPGEVEQLQGAGFHSVHLGTRTLRFETAALALVTSVQLLWGDLGQ